MGAKEKDGLQQASRKAKRAVKAQEEERKKVGVFTRCTVQQRHPDAAAAGARGVGHELRMMVLLYV